MTGYTPVLPNKGSERQQREGRRPHRRRDPDPTSRADRTALEQRPSSRPLRHRGWIEDERLDSALAVIQKPYKVWSPLERGGGGYGSADIAYYA